jgi:protein-tyrosine phosphatase
MGPFVDDIIDCTSEGSQHAHRSKVLHLPPTGTNSHQWEAADLNDIVDLAEGCLLKGRRVLIHCNRGVSRSTCAVAAVLLHMGHATTVQEAVAMARHEDRVPVKTAQASLTRWWADRQQMALV